MSKHIDGVELLTVMTRSEGEGHRIGCYWGKNFPQRILKSADDFFSHFVGHVKNYLGELPAGQHEVAYIIQNKTTGAITIEGEYTWLIDQCDTLKSLRKPLLDGISKEMIKLN